MDRLISKKIIMLSLCHPNFITVVAIYIYLLPYVYNYEQTEDL